MRAKLFRDVPFARAGAQQYLSDEIGERPGQVVTVERPADEVRRSVSSFECCPLTEGHPSGMVTAENADQLAVGIVTDCRFDNATQQVRGDIIVWDQSAIRTIADGLRELSAGYDAEYRKNGERYEQVDIRANHVALVPRGRSGSAQRIGG